eukprot:15481121-Alexandrium_andersonii.AAC.1
MNSGTGFREYLRGHVGGAAALVTGPRWAWAPRPPAGCGRKAPRAPGAPGPGDREGPNARLFEAR